MLKKRTHSEVDEGESQFADNEETPNPDTKQGSRLADTEPLIMTAGFEPQARM